jgi:hypothetical protein
MVGKSARRNVLFKPAVAPAGAAAEPGHDICIAFGWLDPHHGDTIGDCALDDLCGAADAGRRLAVPDRDQHLDICQHEKARRLVGAGTLIGFAVKLEYVAGAGEQLFELAARHLRLEITLVLGPVERQDGLQCKTGRKPRCGDDAVRAFRQRGDDDECFRGFCLARGIDDCSQHALDERAQWRFGVFGQFRRHPMAADADAQAGRGSVTGRAHGRGRPTFCG